MGQEYQTGQSAEVTLARVKSHCSLPPYLRLVRQTIKAGCGLVRLNYVRGSSAGVSGNAYDSFLGSVEVPLNSLIF